MLPAGPSVVTLSVAAIADALLDDSFDTRPCNHTMM